LDVGERLRAVERERARPRRAVRSVVVVGPDRTPRSSSLTLHSTKAFADVQSASVRPALDDRLAAGVVLDDASRLEALFTGGFGWSYEPPSAART